MILLSTGEETKNKLQPSVKLKAQNVLFNSLDNWDRVPDKKGGHTKKQYVI